MFPFPIAVYALQAFHGFTFNIVTACSPVYAASLAPENLRASAQGTLASAQGFAQAIVPLIGGFVCQRYGWGSLYGFLAGLALLGLIMFLASDGDRIARKEALTANALFRN
jgi:MFS family permease